MFSQIKISFKTFQKSSRAYCAIIFVIAHSFQVSVATKVNPWSERGLTRTSVLKQVATCLESLQTNCVDLLYLHAPDHNTPIEETLGAIQEVYKGLNSIHLCLKININSLLVILHI